MTPTHITINHADQQTLCDWVKSMSEPPGEIRLVHGEKEVQKNLTARLDVLFQNSLQL
jgi:predicted metal-dependent RNase